MVIPPRKTVVLSSEDEDEQTDRDRHILELKANGRMVWQRAHDYGRCKSIVADRLHACHDDAHPVELAIGIKVFNQMMNLAKPVSERGGELPEQGETRPLNDTRNNAIKSPAYERSPGWVSFETYIINLTIPVLPWRICWDVYRVRVMLDVIG